MLLPSAGALHAENSLPQGFRPIGAARRKLTDEAFRAMAMECSGEIPAARPPESGSACRLPVPALSYADVDMSNPQGSARVREMMGDAAEKEVAVFLSIAPNLFTQAITALKGSGLAGDNVRVGVEKPLGEDLASSRVIDDCIASLFPEGRTYRFDHYLGKETVQNLLVLRFGNLLFEPVWNAQFIDHVQITVAETIGLEGRSDYFDATGSLRDMVQNHMLQLLALLAMEPPGQFEAGAVRDEKVKVLQRAASAQSPEPSPAIPCWASMARAPSPMNACLPYAGELGHPSQTETFVALKANIDNWRWQGVPFYLRTGKRLAARKTEVAIQFKPVPHSMFAGRGGKLEANKMRLRLQPQEDIGLSMMARVPGLDRHGIRLQDVPLDLSLASVFGNQIRRFRL